VTTVACRAGEIDENEPARRAACQLAQGADPVMIERALAEACSRDYEMPADCKKRRPGSAFGVRRCSTSQPPLLRFNPG